MTRRCFSRIVFSWLLLTVCLVVFMRVAGDHWWPATLLLFGPRWMLLLPLFILLPLILRYNRQQISPLIIIFLITIFSFMGFNLPFRKIISMSVLPEKPAIRVLTCNIQSGQFNRSRLNALINEVSADIVALQECPRDIKLLLPKGWQIFQDGGLAIMSRYPLHSGSPLLTLHPPHVWPRTSLLQCKVSVPGGDVTFCNVHLPSPRYGMQNVLDRKTIVSFTRSDLLKRETEHRLKTASEVQRSIKLLNMSVVIAGDFNMPVESAIYRKIWSGYNNAFSSVGLGFGWTEHASFRGVPLAVRIDHILTDEGLIPKMCQVGPDVGSDHLPVIADVIRTVL